MKDSQKIFLDSNVVIYAYCNNSADKQQKAKQLFAEKTVVISTQVLQETANTLHRKFKADFHTIRLLLEECVLNVTALHVNTYETVLKACAIAESYKFSFYDGLIIASALEAECQILYSEDMQHNQIIEGKLKVINPFRPVEPNL
jgi:predicted nucleic acid-binding protein